MNEKSEIRKEIKKEEKKTFIKNDFLFIVLFGVIIFFVISWFLLDFFITSNSPFISDEEIRAYFGNKFGAVSALFSGLAFAALIITILLQRKDLEIQRDDLKLQRSELKLQREELKSTREVFINQSETMRIQRFETTFFNLLNLYNQVLDNLEYGQGMSLQKGRKCFYELNRSLEAFLDKNGTKINHSISSTSNLEFITNGYENFYKNTQSLLGHYFRTLYQILKFIDNSDINDKATYVSFLRTQLSSYEQTLIFYSCLYKNGKVKFKPLIEKYSLFKNLDESLLLHPKNKEYYESSAFG